MRTTLTAIALAAGLLPVGGAYAQQQPAAPAAPPNLDIGPDKMPFATPYGAPIAMERAQAAIQAAVAEANKRGWALNIAVVDPNGDLVTFARMDGAMLASIVLSQHKARTAARYRRPTHTFLDGVQKVGFNFLLTARLQTQSARPSHKGANAHCMGSPDAMRTGGKHPWLTGRAKRLRCRHRKVYGP